MRELDGAAMVNIVPGSKRIWEACCEAAGIRTVTVAEMSSVASVMVSVRYMGAAAVVPAMALTSADTTRVRGIPLINPKPERTVGCLWRRQQYQSQLSKVLAIMLREAVVELGRPHLVKAFGLMRSRRGTKGDMTQDGEAQGWQLEWCQVQRVRTRYAVAGEREQLPVVLLHGVGRSLEDWSAAVPLAERFRLYAPDLIGFGYTDKPKGPYTLERLATFIKNFLDEVGETRPVVLVGNSLGGAAAQSFAVQYPERIRGLVLVASAGFGQEVILALRLVTVPGLGELLMKPSKRNARNTVKSLFHNSRFATEERVVHTLDLARQPGAARAFLATVRSLGTWRGVKAAWREELSRRLALLELPTLLIWGEYDEVLPAAQLEAARALYPHAKTHLFEDTGHAPQLEQADLFNASVLTFLEDHL